MNKRGHAVQYPPFIESAIAKFFNHLLEEGYVDSKLLGKVLESCPTLFDKVNFLSAVLLQPLADQQREWIEAFGLAWKWTDVLYGSEFKYEVMRSGYKESSAKNDDRTIN